ncbi:uncharacterized protein TOT_010001123 [Theileria orientalis strain Shintoku]|uniref:HECT domain-containing protein n=1 Tax=Theileria orientalis strain Shintoku TaxID=869250 RepID=J4DNW5_THEOR|nr:uncharacterized protein TOT_010001123 [Theileria orientalis strain Shintoku]BAM39669.1 uncharacterized protein TOT_010001123 [Theileria orientalis strain Shintoku]|eukprot:XP_009689970.1 uncharacterized protein TOT_010001123 [Theileria orientalis strain Shintoku]
MESENNCDSPPTDPPFSQARECVIDQNNELDSKHLFRLLVYTKHTALSRLKLVDSVDFKKEFLVLHEAHRTIYSLRSKLLKHSKHKSSPSSVKTNTKRIFADMLMSFKKCDGLFKAKADEACKLKVQTDESTSLSIDLGSLLRVISVKDMFLKKLDPNDEFILGHCLDIIKSKYNYDFSTLVSHWNVINQIFLCNYHEVQVMSKENKGSHSNPLKLDDTIPLIYELYNNIGKYRNELREKILDSKVLEHKLVKEEEEEEKKKEESKMINRKGKIQEKGTEMKSFEHLAKRVHKDLENNHVLLNIRIFELNKSTVEDVTTAIKPVLKEIRDEIQSQECDYQYWMGMFTQNYEPPKSSEAEEVYRVLSTVLDFSFGHNLYDLGDLTTDLIFTFAMRDPNLSRLLRSFTKYFDGVLLPAFMKYAAELRSMTSDSYSSIWIPSLPSLESVLSFEYLALQYPVMPYVPGPQDFDWPISLIPKSGTFVMRLDIEILDRIDYTKIYTPKANPFNLKITIKNTNTKGDPKEYVLRAYGNAFFVSNPKKRQINAGSSKLCLEILFNNSTAVLFTNGTYFDSIKFAQESLDFFELEVYYRVETVNLRQYYTLTPGFRKYLIKSNLLHHHIFVTSDECTKISVERPSTRRVAKEAQLVTTRSELESTGYVRRVFDNFAFFSMALSSVHMATANINFSITMHSRFDPLSRNALECLDAVFELLVRMFELTSEMALEGDLRMLSEVASVNVITLWRLMSEALISALSVVEMLFSLKIEAEEYPENFLNNLSKILIEAIKYKCTFRVDGQISEYHHPIDLVSLSNTVNNISIGILGSNSQIFKQLFSTSPIQVLSEILLSIAYSDLHYVSDLTVLAKNRTLEALNEGMCIEIFTKRALSHVFDDRKATQKGGAGGGISNFWWNLISELLEADMNCLHSDGGRTFSYCTCKGSLSDLSLLDPMFDYCTFCLRKYFNYFSSITSLNYHMTKLYTSESFCSILRPSMMLCRILLKHGTIILLFDLYDSEYNRKKIYEPLSQSGDGYYPLEVLEFERYYYALFEPSNLKLIESILVYLLKMKENILTIMSDRVDILSKYILDYFGLLLHNFVSCLSLLEVLSYYAEFMELVLANNGCLFHLASFACINLMPYLIKVILLYNKIFKAYSAKYQKFSPFMNYLTVQFSSLFLIFMKLVHYVYMNTDKLRYRDLEGVRGADLPREGDPEGNHSLSSLKDKQYQLKFPKCVTSRLDFNFTLQNGSSMSSGFGGAPNAVTPNAEAPSAHNPESATRTNQCADNETWSNLDSDCSSEANESCSSEEEEREFEICKSLRRLLILVQDFNYVKGSTVAFKNIKEVDAFISKKHGEGQGVRRMSDVTSGLLNMEKWAVNLLIDYMNPVHPHLVKTQYTLAALFIHLQGWAEQEESDQPGEYRSFGSHPHPHGSYSDPIKYSNQVAFRILRKCQAINTIQEIKDKDALREAYLEDVRARCIWLIKISNEGHYSGRQSCENSSEKLTTTYKVVDHFKTTMEKAAPTLRRSNSTMHLNAEPLVVQDGKMAQESLKKVIIMGAKGGGHGAQMAQESPRQSASSLEGDMDEIIDFILNGPSEQECNNRLMMLRMSWLIRLSLLSSVNALIYSFLDQQYTNGPSTFRQTYRPLILDLILEKEVAGGPGGEEERGRRELTATKNMNQTLEIFWYILIQKLRSLVLCTLKDANFDLVNGVRVVPSAYARAVNEYMSGILESVCDWYIRSGITTIDSTNYTKVNMNFWLEISLSFFSLLYSLGLEPMTDARYSHQIFNHLFTVLHPLPMADLKQAMSNQTSLSCYTIEAVIVAYISESFGANFEDTVENLFSCLKTRKFTRKDKVAVEGGTLYLLVRRSSKLPDMFRPDQPNDLKFRHLWSFPKISLTTDGFGQFLIYNFESINTIEALEGPGSPPTGSKGSGRSSGGWVSMLDNDIILWRMENSSYLITEVALTKRTNHNVNLVISSTREINVFLTLTKNLSSKKTTEIELPLVNYLGGSLQVEGLNGTWSQVVGFTRFDDLYKMRVHLYHLMKYLLWVELGTNLHTSGNREVSDNGGLLLKILFKYLRSTALQIYRLGTSCNCKDKTENVSIKYTCSNISTGFKYAKEVQGYLVDSDDYMDKPLISRSCSLCSSNLIYKKEMDFFWGNILSCLIELVSFCNNYNLVYLVLHSLLTTFTLGERQVQAFLSMDYLGQRFCNLLVVAIKQLSSTSVASQIPAYPKTSATKARKFGVNNFSYLNTLLAAPKIHGVFVLKWLPPLKQVPLECIYATLKENFQSILISKPLRPKKNIEPNDPFVMLPHSEHFVTHRTSEDFEADISGNTLQVVRANNLGGIVMYRIPTTLGSSSTQLSANFYLHNAGRFGITVAPADCIFGSLPDLFERNDVVGFTHSNTSPLMTHAFAATIGYSLGDVLTAHFTIDTQDDGQLCLRTELLIGGNSIGSVLEVVYDPITQNDLSRRMSLVFIFQDPATILLQNTTVNANTQGQQGQSMSNQQPSSGANAPNESNIINTFLTSNMRRERMSNGSTVDAVAGEGAFSLESDVIPTERTAGPAAVERGVSSNSDVVRTLDRLVSRETSGTVRSISVVGDSVPVSERAMSIESNLNLMNDLDELGDEGDLDLLLDDNMLMFNYETYFSCDAKEPDLLALEAVPQWDVSYDAAEQEASEEVSLNLCKDEFWDKLLREDKYTCFFGLFSDSVQIYQSVLSVNVPMFSGLKHELVSKVVECFDDLYSMLNSNLKYNKLESKVRDCFSWLCVLCCEYDREVWDKMAAREFKVVSDFSLPFLLGSSFPARTPLVSLTNELLLQLLRSISRILTVRLVTTSMSVYSTKRGSVRFMHSDVQTDSLILIVGAKCLLAATLILKVLSHRSYKIDLHGGGRESHESEEAKSACGDESAPKMSNEKLTEMVEGLVNFVVYFLSCCSDELVTFTNTTEILPFSKLESILNILGVDASTLNTQATYKTHKNTLQSVELLQLDELWNTIYSSNPSFDLMQSLVMSLMRKEKDHEDEEMEKIHVKMFATTEKSFHFASRIPAVRRHVMRRSQFYRLIEHDVYEMLQPLVQVFTSHFKMRILSRCTTTLSLLRSSLVHFAATADANALDYWECCTVDYTSHKGRNFKSKMDLFSRASDPLYAWQALIYSCYEREEDKSKLLRVLTTELTYCVVLAIGSLSFVKFLEPVYWMLDTLVRHPLCPYELREDLTNKVTLNMLYFLFINGMASPPKMAHLSTRILNNAMASLTKGELEQALFLTMYFGATAFKRVQSVCNFYVTSDLDMFTNFDHKRHDHMTRLATANIVHSFLTAFVLLVEAINEQRDPEDDAFISSGPLWDAKFLDFYNMGVYLYLAKNRRLTKAMLLGMLSLPVQVSTETTAQSIPKALDKLGISQYQSAPMQNTYTSFKTFGNNYGMESGARRLLSSKLAEYSESGLPKLRDTLSPVKQAQPGQGSRGSHTGAERRRTRDLSEEYCEFYYMNCSNRYFGMLLNLPVEAPTRFLFSQYRDFSKVFAELVVSPTREFEAKPGFHLLDEYLMNVSFMRYRLVFGDRSLYRVGYTKSRSFECDYKECTRDQLYIAEHEVYLVTDALQVEMYISNSFMFWRFKGKVMSVERTDGGRSLPFLYITDRSAVQVAFDITIPVNSCFVKAHEETFETKSLGNGKVVTPPIRTGLSVHNTRPLFPNVSLIDVSKSALVKLNTDLLMNMEPDNTLRFDPCLPFRLSFKFERGFDEETSAGFYVGLISKSEKLLWYANGDLLVSTNFHVPAKPGEYRKIKCMPYEEKDVISISFDPINSSLYFTNNAATQKLNFFNYYYHITNVHTNSLINSNKDSQRGLGENGEDELTEDDDISPLKEGGDLGKDLKEGETIVGNYSDLNFTCADRRSLINAIIFDDMNKIKKFLDFPCELFENGCDDHFDVEGDDYFLFSPIYIVANLGKLPMLKLIATNKNINFDVKSGPFKTTPLMGAVKAGHYNVVYYLITVHSLDINSLDSIGNNCLYYAIRASKRYDNDIVELLLNFGVKVQPSANSCSVLDFLDTIPGDTALQKRLIDEYKLQSVYTSRPGWPLLQNLQIVMSSKLHVKYNIKIDPPRLSPVAQAPTGQASRGSHTGGERQRTREDEEGGDILELMGNYLESFGEEVKDKFSTAVDLVADSFQTIRSPSPARASEPEVFEEERMKKMDTEFQSLLKTLSEHYNSINSNLSYTRSLDRGPTRVAQYVRESVELIRKHVYKIASELGQTGALPRVPSTEMELSASEMIMYHLTNLTKAVERFSKEDKKLKNFVLLTNQMVKTAATTKEKDELLCKYVKYENELVSFGVAPEELRFSSRLEKNGKILKENGIIESCAHNKTNYVYVTTNEKLISGRGEVRKGPPTLTRRMNLRVTGSLYTFDALRQAMNECITFERDRCLVSLVDLLRNSNKKLATLSKILVLSNECSDVQKYLPPSDSQLWSSVSVTIEHIFNNVYALKKDMLGIFETYPLSHIDLQLLHTVLTKSLEDLDLLKNFEPLENTSVESRLLEILGFLGIVNAEVQNSLKKTRDLKSNASNINYTFNFTDEYSNRTENGQNSMSIRALSSPHLINRVDPNNQDTQLNSVSRLYQEIFNSSISQSGGNVLIESQGNKEAANSQQNARALGTRTQNDKGLEANFVPNADGLRNGRSTGADYIFHCVSIVLLADRLKYYDTVATIFKNVIPVVSTILNQPKIEYRSQLSLISQPPEYYYGEEESVKDQNKYSVSLGPSMPIHYSVYLNNKPLIRKTTLNEMYDKIYTLKSLSAERPYFSIRVDRGIAHTTQLLKNSMWFQSTSQILNCNPNILRAKNNQRPFMVVFKGEGSTDFGGPFQELLTCISNEFMFPLAPDNDSQTATIRCQNTINNYGMHQDTVLLKFSHYPIHKLFSNVEETETTDQEEEAGARPEESDECSTVVSETTDKLFTMGCCDLGLCCSSGCCCILPSQALEEPLDRLDLGTSCRCGASEMYSEVCNQKIPMELSMYESLGRLCAMCACMMNPMNIAINPIIWKKLLCYDLKLIDLLDCDKISVDLLHRLKSLSATGVVTEEDLDGLVFSLEGCEGATVDLVENGSNLPVLPSNLDKYIKLSTLFRLSEGDLGCTFLARGINSVIPIGRLRTLLDHRSLEFVVCGDSIVDLSVLRAHTVSYSINLKRDLFDVLARFNNDMLQLFLRFVSGRSRLPHPNSDWCLRLEYDNKGDVGADSRLPTSATCSFRLLMPKYSSLDVMHRRLIYAIENCIAIDLDAHVIHDEMQLSIN